VGGAGRRSLGLAFRLVPFTAADVLLPLPLPASLRPPRGLSSFAAPMTLLTARRSFAARGAAGLIVAAALLSATSGFLARLRLRALPMRLRLSTLLPAATAGFAGLRALLRTPRSVFVSSARPAPALLRSAPCALLGSAPPAVLPPTLPPGFLMGVGARDARQGKRAADGDRAEHSAPVS
jgi:hypothetical protein